MRLGDPGTREALQQALARDATRLAADDRCPIDLDVVARRLGVRLYFDSAALADGQLRQHRTGSEVVVRGRDGSDPRARFSAAHELAHHVLDLYGAPRPADRREYWELERICHDFAGRLLVPDAALAWVREAHPEQSVHLLELARRIAERTQVSRAVVSHRLAHDLGGVSFSEVGFPRRSGTGLAGVVRWMVERFPWLRRGVRSHIAASHFLAPLLSAQARRGVGTVSVGQANALAVAAERRPWGVWIVCLDPAALRSRDAPAQLHLPISESEDESSIQHERPCAGDSSPLVGGSVTSGPPCWG